MSKIYFTKLLVKIFIIIVFIIYKLITETGQVAVMVITLPSTAFHPRCSIGFVFVVFYDVGLWIVVFHVDVLL